MLNTKLVATVVGEPAAFVTRPWNDKIRGGETAAKTWPSVADGTGVSRLIWVLEGVNKNVEPEITSAIVARPRKIL